MTHLAMLLFAYAGFVGICASMAKHQPELLGAKLEPLRQRQVRWGGAAGLAAAYACALRAAARSVAESLRGSTIASARWPTTIVTSMERPGDGDWSASGFSFTRRPPVAASTQFPAWPRPPASNRTYRLRPGSPWILPTCQ